MDDAERFVNELSAFQRKQSAVPTGTSRFARLKHGLRRLFRREPELPGDPFASVTAPRKPGPSPLRSSAVAEWPE